MEKIYTLEEFINNIKRRKSMFRNEIVKVPFGNMTIESESPNNIILLYKGTDNNQYKIVAQCDEYNYYNVSIIINDIIWDIGTIEDELNDDCIYNVIINCDCKFY